MGLSKPSCKHTASTVKLLAKGSRMDAIPSMPGIRIALFLQVSGAKLGRIYAKNDIS